MVQQLGTRSNVTFIGAVLPGVDCLPAKSTMLSHFGLVRTVEDLEDLYYIEYRRNRLALPYLI